METWGHAGQPREPYLGQERIVEVDRFPEKTGSVDRRRGCALLGGDAVLGRAAKASCLFVPGSESFRQIKGFQFSEISVSAGEGVGVLTLAGTAFFLVAAFTLSKLRDTRQPGGIARKVLHVKA